MLRLPAPFAFAAVSLLLAACSPDRATSIPLNATTAGGGPTSQLTASSWGPETPPFNDEIILRDVGDGNGFGHVKFRQPNDGDRIVYLDTWVRDLKPNTTYQ